MNAASTNPSLAFTRSLQASSLGVKALAVLLGSAFIAAAAQVTVPMYPVPMTMQTFAVLLVGSLYGGRLAAATLAVYLLEGALGLPVFANAGSIATLMVKPLSAGYLIGFFAAATLAGWLADRGAFRTLAGTVGTFAAASMVVYLFGLPWLAAGIGVEKAIAFGLLPFILGDVLKATLAASVRALVGRVSVGRKA
ncbi:biotin transporter BioY [Chthonobacter albigriseus]|uniref:biotin transporter BioY n=1 Tax=Chthonobacter albigriseus TaxID=1683161 RepID=UPI0015EFD985|nr:biotin transporter BioY [Chthonobacter albigriseus]